MKIKRFNESLRGNPKVGDYVICKDSTTDENDDFLIDFLKNNIGQIFEIYDEEEVVKSMDGKFPYLVQYKNIPNEILDSFKAFDTDLDDDIRYSSRIFGLSEIKHFSSNIEDLEYLVNANKYNL